MPEVEIYTDGGCEPNPGVGGYGVVLLHPKKRLEASGGFRLTTNNRMEIFAAIKGLELLKEPCKVTLYSDSRYLVNAIVDGWALDWKKRDWWRTTKERVKAAVKRTASWRAAQVLTRRVRILFRRFSR
jgi:ribonuclease HI